MLSNESIEEVLTFGYERRGFELKGPGSRTDSHLMLKVVRAAIGMGNLRDGGHVIIGIEDKKPQAMLPGLSADDLASWTYDDVARKMAEYVDPPLMFDLNLRTLTSGATVVVIEVFEFLDLPHLCAKGDGQTLRKGALYIRPRKVPETSEVASSVEMREILDLAAEKRLRAYIATAVRAGVKLAPGGTPDDDCYTGEVARAWTSNPVTDKIRSKGYWEVTIRAGKYDQGRIAYRDLVQVLTRAAVRFRGWPVPFVDDRESLTRGDDWIGQDVDAHVVAHFEAWRFFTSGLFCQLRSISADWRSGVERTPVSAGYTSVIEVWEILYYLTEIFELAARLALNAAGTETETMTVTAHLTMQQETALVAGRRDRAPLMLEPYRAPAELSARTMTLPREKLIAEPGPAAAEMAQEIFARFGWNPSIQALQIMQRELGRGR